MSLDSPLAPDAANGGRVAPDPGDPVRSRRGAPGIAAQGDEGFRRSDV